MKDKFSLLPGRSPRSHKLALRYPLLAFSIAIALPGVAHAQDEDCLLYTSPSPRD